MDWWLDWPRACETSGKLERSIIRYASWWRSECSRSPAVTRTRTIQPACPGIRFTNCFWTAIRSKVASWLRSRRCRVSRTELGSRNSIVREFLAESVIRRHAKRLRHRTYRVTIDLDPTDDPTHGAQQLSFFNGHYDTWCYLPVMGFVSCNDEAEQYLCAAVLRPGNVTAAVGAVAMLRRLVRMIRHHIPGVQIRIRLDGGFAHPAVLQFLDARPKLEYVVAMAKNAVLKRVEPRSTAPTASTPPTPTTPFPASPPSCTS